MTKVNQNLKINRGDTYVVFIALTNADGSQFDPSANAIFKYRIARTSHSPENKSLVRKSLADGIALVTSPVKGVNVTLEAKDTDFFPGLYYHELKVLDGSDVTTTMTGTVVIKRALKMDDIVSPPKEDLVIVPTSPTIMP